MKKNLIFSVLILSISILKASDYGDDDDYRSNTSFNSELLEDLTNGNFVSFFNSESMNQCLLDAEKAYRNMKTTLINFLDFLKIAEDNKNNFTDEEQERLKDLQNQAYKMLRINIIKMEKEYLLN